MRIFSCLILSFFLFINASIIYAEQNNDEKAISSFEKHVSIFKKFFATKPKYLEKQSYDGSPSGYIYFWVRFDNAQISYDVQKTNSLISPYMGYITVIHDEFESNKCGDFNTYDTNRSYSTRDLARKDKENNSCYSEVPSAGTKYVFALQKGVWVFKDMINNYNNKTHPRFLPLVGQSGGGRFPVKDNDFWKALLQP